MITLLLWCTLNAMLFHIDASNFTVDTQAIILVVCLASDLNFIFNRK